MIAIFKNYYFFLLIITFLPFSLMAMDVSSGTIATFQSVETDQFIIEKIENIPRIEKNQWILYNVNIRRGIVVNIDLFVNCEGDSQDVIDEKNNNFTASLEHRIQNREITAFGKTDVAKRAIPCDNSINSLLTFVSFLRFVKCFQNKKIFQAQYEIKKNIWTSTEDCLHQLSLNQFLEYVNLSTNLGISPTYISKNGVKANLKDFLIDHISKKVNENIASFMQIGETALSDIFCTSADTQEGIESQHQEQLKKFNTYKKEFDKLKRVDIELIMHQLTYSAFVAPQYQNPKKYFNDMSYFIKSNTNITTEYLLWLENIFNSYANLFNNAQDSKKLDDLMNLVQQYVSTMINERRNRNNEPKLWQVTVGSSAEDPTVSKEKTEKIMAKSLKMSEPTGLGQMMAAQEKDMTVQQKILGMIVAGGVSAYLLYLYLTQKQ